MPKALVVEGAAGAVGAGYQQGESRERRVRWVGSATASCFRESSLLQDSHTFAPLFSGSRGSHFGCLQDLTDLARLRILATTAERLPA